MKAKHVTGLVAAAFVIGIVIGLGAGGSFVLWKTIRFETDAIATAVADRTFSLVPLVIALEKENEEDRLDNFESAARSQLTAGVVALHASLPMLSENKRDHMEGILKSVARNREKLSLGRFDNPPLEHIEEILESYSD